ncbi:hypothetical protein [Xylophilus sp. GOD-11R]|uniref:hypothetical protein n=1 Tax=Xylophilus sp. GOD-11R TaxID=3089814 RepID=UPI00298CF19E|nr:hypothetical protein [Xylophilus sp. GOD-11R]WPB57971.1 hypothetical protein R9X41_04810 [Xylophilus sp. GOD-11R]
MLPHFSASPTTAPAARDPSPQPDPVLADGKPSERSTYEHLPDELLLLTAEYLWELTVALPAQNSLPGIASLNGRLASVFREPVLAVDITRPLSTARTLGEFLLAVDGLERTPPSHRQWCWDSVVAAMVQFVSDYRSEDRDVVLAAVLARLPADPDLRLRVVQQASNALLRQAAGFSGVVPPLIAACAGLPRVPRAMLLQWMQMLLRNPPQPIERRAIEAAAEALPSARHTELTLMLDLVAAPAWMMPLPAVLSHLQRITALPPGPVVTMLYQTLLRHWAGAGSVWRMQGATAIFHALLDAAESPGWREDAMSLLPVVQSPTPDLRPTLLRQLDLLRPAAAMALLARQWPTFTTNAARAPTECADVLRRARATPAEHREATLALARKVRSVSNAGQRADLARLLMDELPRLPLVDRLPVLAACDSLYFKRDGWRDAWSSAWQDALQACCQAATQSDIEWPLRDTIRALAAALPFEEWTGRVPQSQQPRPQPLSDEASGSLVHALSRLLRCLPPHQVPGAVRDIVQAYRDQGRQEGPSDATMRMLLRVCAGLPCDLRSRPLHDLRSRDEEVSHDTRQMLRSLMHGAQAQREQWRAQRIADAAR